MFRNRDGVLIPPSRFPFLRWPQERGRLAGAGDSARRFRWCYGPR